MKNFFQTVFGSLAAIAFGIAVAWGAGRLWVMAFPNGAGERLHSAVAAAETAISRPSDGTSIAGMKRVIHYTADEEEDLINQAAMSLPAGADGRVTAEAYLVKDEKTGAIAAEFDQDRLLPIASLTKLVTAAVARKLIPADTEITITPEIMRTYGNTAEFKAGEDRSRPETCSILSC